MPTRFSKPAGDGASGEIVAAIKFDAAAPYLIQAAAALAKRAKRKLRLVHIYSTDYPAYPESYMEAFGPRGFSSELQQETYLPIAGEGVDDDPLVAEKDTQAASWGSPVEHARSMLREYARLHVPTDVPTETTILIGTFPESLLENAASLGAALVVTGAATKDPGFLRAKLKHTFRLMAKTELPVLVIKDALEPFQIPDRPVRMLLTDDLTDASLPVLSSAATLLSIFGLRADILHLHVEPQPTAGFALSPDYALEVWPGVSIRERLVNDQHERLLARLKQRAHDLAEKVIEAGGRYRTQLWHGRVEEEICRAAAVHQADLTVFGQHRFLHRDPLTLGQMPFGAMLNVGSAILVAPPNPS